MKQPTNVRVRMAPSPTGTLHLGTARTALFNYLYAQQTQGVFVMRIEDTDKERSHRRYEHDILEGLQWLGIQWDEGVFLDTGDTVSSFRQSARTEIYEHYLNFMLEQGTAFYCGCTPDELQAERVQQTASQQPLRHTCCRQKAPSSSQKERGIIRFRNPYREPHKVAFTDLIKGEIEFDVSLLGDFSIAKDTTTPLYNFAVVVDDFDMKITHILRGEDHISNTPKQILLQDSLDIARPAYAHLPLLLGPDSAKLSKRHGAVSVGEYRSQGYIQEALFNFMALLGWHPLDDVEVLSKDEIIQQFSLERVQTSPAMFDITKLQWMNKTYLNALSSTQFYRVAQEYLRHNTQQHTEEFLKCVDDPLLDQEKVYALEQSRIAVLSEVPDTLLGIVKMQEYDVDILRYKDQSFADVLCVLGDVRDILQGIPQDKWGSEVVSPQVLLLCETYGQKGVVLHPFRVALSGQKSSPPPFEIIDAIGRQYTLERVDTALSKLRQASQT